MPQLKLRYTKRAQTDLSDIYKYVGAHDKLAAKRIITAIENSAIILADHPLSGRQTDFANVRVKPVPNYPYLLFYIVGENDLVILRVWHTARQWPEQL
jgi:toxin ParE1/3/4